MRILETDKFGPTYRFCDQDVLYFIISFENGTSRKTMSERLDIGEGSIRTMISMLIDFGLLENNGGRICLTSEGNNLKHSLGTMVFDIDVGDSVVGQYQCGALVKGMARRVQKGVEQRNSGLKSGGDGCSTWIVRNGRLYMAPDWDVEKNNPGLAEVFRTKIPFEDEDVILVGGGDSPRSARNAALGAALSLL